MDTAKKATTVFGTFTAPEIVMDILSDIRAGIPAGKRDLTCKPSLVMEIYALLRTRNPKARFRVVENTGKGKRQRGVEKTYMLIYSVV